MGGLITHLIAGFASGLIIHLIHKRLEFSFIIFLGNLLPDTIKFGFSALIKGTINLSIIKSLGTYWFLNDLTTDMTNWFTVGFFIIALLSFLIHYHLIKKKTFEEYEELTGLLILGIITHLIIDLFIIESSPWI